MEADPKLFRFQFGTHTHVSVGICRFAWHKEKEIFL